MREDCVEKANYSHPESAKCPNLLDDELWPQNTRSKPCGQVWNSLAWGEACPCPRWVVREGHISYCEGQCSEILRNDESGFTSVLSLFDVRESTGIPRHTALLRELRRSQFQGFGEPYSCACRGDENFR